MAHDPFSPVRVPNYRMFAVAFLCSAFALQMLGHALSWEVYERTGSKFMLGLIGVARALPVVLMALPAGQIIDSFRRQRVLALTLLGFAITAALLALVSRAHVSVSVVLVLVSCMGLVRTFNGPSRSSLLPDIVPEGIFANAVTWNVGLFQFAAVCGPLLSGLIIRATGGAWTVYAISSGLCAVGSVCAGQIRPLREAPMGGFTLRGLWSGMGAGVAHVRKEKVVLSTITLDLLAVILGGVTGLLPAYAKDILHTDALGLGFLRASPFLGAFLMSVYLAAHPLKRRAGALLLLSVAIFGVCMVIFAFSTWMWLSLLVLFLSGGVDNVSVVIRHILVQSRTPPHLRGRVSAVNSVFIECSNELGSFESGAVAEGLTGWLGPIRGTVWSAAGGGIGTLLVVLGVAWAWPELRRLDSLDAPKT